MNWREPLAGLVAVVTVLGTMMFLHYETNRLNSERADEMNKMNGERADRIEARFWRLVDYQQAIEERVQALELQPHCGDEF